MLPLPFGFEIGGASWQAWRMPAAPRSGPSSSLKIKAPRKLGRHQSTDSNCLRCCIEWVPRRYRAAVQPYGGRQDLVDSPLIPLQVKLEIGHRWSDNWVDMDFQQLERTGWGCSCVPKSTACRTDRHGIFLPQDCGRTKHGRGLRRRAPYLRQCSSRRTAPYPTVGTGDWLLLALHSLLRGCGKRPPPHHTALGT